LLAADVTRDTICLNAAGVLAVSPACAVPTSAITRRRTWTQAGRYCATFARYDAAPPRLPAGRRACLHHTAVLWIYRFSARRGLRRVPQTSHSARFTPRAVADVLTKLDGGSGRAAFHHCLPGCAPYTPFAVAPGIQLLRSLLCAYVCCRHRRRQGLRRQRRARALAFERWADAASRAAAHLPPRSEQSVHAYERYLPAGVCGLVALVAFSPCRDGSWCVASGYGWLWRRRRLAGVTASCGSLPCRLGSSGHRHHLASLVSSLQSGGRRADGSSAWRGHYGPATHLLHAAGRLPSYEILRQFTTRSGQRGIPAVAAVRLTLYRRRTMVSNAGRICLRLQDRYAYYLFACVSCHSTRFSFCALHAPRRRIHCRAWCLCSLPCPLPPPARHACCTACCFTHIRRRACLSAACRAVVSSCADPSS